MYALSVTSESPVAPPVSLRVRDEPAYVLHHYDWSESSLIAELWSRHHGRVAVVAKGAKKPASQLRGVLLPLQILSVHWSGDGEIRTLKGAQWGGGLVMPQGDALLAGLYLNELVLRTLARDDPHPALFEVYDAAVRGLHDEAQRSGVLRAFELLWLQGLGVLPALHLSGSAQRPLQDEVRYRLEPELGLQVSEAEGLSGAQWRVLAQAFAAQQWSEAGVQHCVAWEPVLRVQLRKLLHYHSGLSAFRTRQLWLDVGVAGQRARQRGAASGQGF